MALESLQPTLEQVVELLGPGVIRVLTSAGPLDRRVGEPVIRDPLDPNLIEAGDMVLAVGMSATSADARELTVTAGHARAAAVCFRASAATPVLVQAAERAGIAVLGVESAVPWGHLHTLLRTAIASAGSLAEAEAGDVAIGDLFGLANAIAAIVGGSVIIDDPQYRVLAYSALGQPIDDPRRESILGRRVPESYARDMREAGVFRALWAGDDLVRFAGPDWPHRPRLAIAVRSGGEILGSIWAAEGDTPFGPPAESAMREAARIAALHLIRYRSTAGLERNMRRDAVQALLSGGQPDEQAIGRLAIDPRAEVAVIGFTLHLIPPASVSAAHDRVLEFAATYCEVYRRRAACAQIGETIYVLAAMMPGPKSTGPTVLARDIVDRAHEALGLDLSAAVGPVVRGFDEVARSRAEVDQILRVIRGGQRSWVATIDDVRSQLVLLDLRAFAADREHWAHGRLHTLLDYDAQHGSTYADTLRAYLNAFGDVAGAAASLNIHPNTLRYRLQRLQELFGLDLHDPAERLLIELQLLLR